MLARASANPKRPGGPMPPIAQTVETIALAKVSRSAADARDLGFLRPRDTVTMNRERLLADAKAKVLDLAKDYAPPEPPRFTLPGPTARTALGLAVDGFVAQGKALPPDRTV